MQHSTGGSRVGGTFGPYQLRSLLGQSTTGSVYEAFDTSRGRVVALKLLADDLSRDPSYAERFRRECRAAAGLREPHVMPIHDWGEIDGVLYLDMPLVPGRDLGAVLRADGPLPPAAAVEIIGQIAAALDAAHSVGLVHRDVTPENILVTNEGFAYLLNVGIGRGAGDGSQAFMAPELLGGGPVDGRADIYSLACVLQEAANGSQNASGPTAFNTVIATGMAHSPQGRYRSASELAHAARDALTQRGPSGNGTTINQLAYANAYQAAPPQSWQPPPARKSPMVPMLLSLLAVLIVALGGAVGWVMLSKDTPADVSAVAARTSARTAPAVATTVPPTTTTAAPVTTRPQVSTSPAPTTRSAPLRTVGVSGADGQGFLAVPGARCNEANPAVAVARTTKSYVTVCLTGAGRYYYKGVRALDGAAIELDDPVPTGSGFIATSNDGTRYVLDSSRLTISSGGEVLGQEPVLEYFRDR